MLIKSLEDVKELASLEDSRRKKAAVVLSGDGKIATKLRADLVPQSTIRAGGKAAELSGTVIELIGDESRAGKRSAADSIIVPHILWGVSQKVQLAGVPCSACF